MDTLRTLIIGALVGVPLLTWGLSWLEQQLSRRVLLIVARVAVLAVLASACGLAAQRSDGQTVDLAIVQWLQMPGFDVTFGVRLDGLAFVQTALVSVVLLLVLSAWPERVSLRWLMLAWFGVTLANVAGNLGQLFVGWTLSAWASSELARKRDAAGFRPVWLVQRVSDIALLAGFGIVWMQFGASLEFAAWTPEAIQALRPELIESIALCVLIGVIGRCAQLPLTVWLETEEGFAAQAGNSMTQLSDEMVGVWNVPDGHHVAERLKADPSNRWHESNEDSVPSVVLAWWLCAVFLPVGVGLLLRFEPFLAVASNTRLLMVAVGVFTSLMCAMNAATQNNWSRVLGQLAVGQCGLLLLTIGLEHPAGDALAYFVLVWQSVMFGVLFVVNLAPDDPVTSGRASNQTVLGLAALLLASGCWGRQAVLDLVWDVTAATQHVDQGPDNVVLGATAARFLPVACGAACLAELLTSLALFRALFLSLRNRTANKSVNWPWMLIVVAFVSVTASSFVVESKAWHEFVTPGIAIDDSQVRSHFGVGLMLPLSATGVVLAWWLYSKPSSLPEKFTAAMGPFARLSRNRFYWDDLYYLSFVHPATVIGEWLVWIDDRVLGRGVRALRNGAARVCGESAEPLSRGSAMIGALTTVGSVAVLAWMLLWLRS